MKTLQQHGKNHINNIKKIESEKTHDYRMQVEREIDRLFITLSAVFPATQYQLIDREHITTTKAVWCMALTQHCNSKGSLIDIKNGIKNCIQSAKPYFPSAGEFIKLCEKYVSDDEIEKAYFDFVKRIDRHDFLFVETKKQCGSDAKKMDSKNAKKVFCKTFDRIARENPARVNETIRPKLTDGAKKPEFGRVPTNSPDSSTVHHENIKQYEKLHGKGSYFKHNRGNGKYTGRTGAPLEVLKMLMKDSKGD